MGKIELVSEWQEPGDMEDNAIESGSLGERNWSAFQFTIYIDEGELEYTYQYDLYGPDDIRRVNISETNSELTGESGWGRYEQSVYLNPRSDWPAGEYRAEVTVKDENSGEVSETKSTTFRLE
ncbi:hypothetical protein CP557_01515 [Natrinema ejinorense]|uniref:Uncharacterized protein n=1 Tax=Natrinema ejinorense TaxID=373386 RepID=A0A2A5QR70_9EURY|nr:hypothetical protein CP557_01515 [Natrinema ejinorense]